MSEIPVYDADADREEQEEVVEEKVKDEEEPKEEKKEADGEEDEGKEDEGKKVEAKTEMKRNQTLLARHASQQRGMGTKSAYNKPPKGPKVEGNLRNIPVPGTPTQRVRIQPSATQDGSPRDKEIDIILVHGLEGDPFRQSGNRVWRKQGSNTTWIRDMLPNKLGPTRLHLYEYETAALKESFGRDLNQLIKGHAKCLLKCIFETLKELDVESIILVGKGFGGLISKLAVIISAQKLATVSSTTTAAGESQQSVAVPSSYATFSQKHIAGVIFIGTPHRGWRNSNGHTYYTHATPPITNPRSLDDSTGTDILLPPADNSINIDQVVKIPEPPKPSQYIATPSTPGSQQEGKLYAELDDVSRQLQEAIRCRLWSESHGTESTFLESLSRDFSQVCRRYEILSVYAVKPTRFTTTTVGKSSALMDIYNETVLELEVRHEDLVRYDDQKEPNYLLLEAAIREFVERVMTRSNQSPEATLQENSVVPGIQKSIRIQRIASITRDRIGQHAIPKRNLSLQRTFSSASASGTTADAAETMAAARKQQEIGELVQKYFPVDQDLPAEIAEVTLKWSVRDVYFHDFEPNHYALHQLAPKTFAIKEKRPESMSEPDSEADHISLQGGFLWVHVPGNDRFWAQDLISRVHAFRYPNIPLGIMSDDYWKYKERCHTYGEGFCHRYMEPSCCTRFIGGPDMQLALYMPYLHWSDRQEHKDRSTALEKIFSSSMGQSGNYERTKHDPLKRLRSISVLGDLCHHPRRTLDQFYYRSIETKTRDGDQIVSHKNPERVLMVDQLWVWVTSFDTIFTFFPQNPAPQKRERRSFADLKSSVHDDLQSATQSQDLCRDALEMTAVCLYHAVTVLLSPKFQKDNGFSVKHIFQETITETNERAVTALNSFVRDPDKHLTINEELLLLQKATDLVDELRILLHLFYEQRKVIRSFISQVKEVSPRAAEIAGDALIMIDEFEEDMTKHQKDAHSARESLLFLLDLKQKKANLDEAQATHALTEASRKEQQESVEQGRTMMIFTVFTIVFLPLSFFTSLYGMNLREWSGEQKNASARSVALYMGSISTVVIVIALVLAFWYRKVQQLLSKVYNRIKGTKGGDSSSEGQGTDPINEEMTGGRQCTV